MEAYSLLEISLKTELDDFLGTRSERMAELYNLAGTIYDEVCTEVLKGDCDCQPFCFSP